MGKKTISLEEGKYIVVFDIDAVASPFYANRYDVKSWRNLVGDKLVLAMFNEILSLRDQLGMSIPVESEQGYHVAYWVAEGVLSGMTIFAPDLITAIQSVCKIKDIGVNLVVYAHAKSSTYAPGT